MQSLHHHNIFFLSLSDLKSPAMITQSVLLRKHKQIIKRLKEKFNSVNVRLNRQQNLTFIGITSHLQKQSSY